MTLLDFPNTPTLGQQYPAPNGATYTWDGTLWKSATTPGSAVAIGATAPTTPTVGQMWWRSDPDGNLYLWYNDGTSSQWVPAMSSVGTISGPAGGDLTGNYPNPTVIPAKASKWTDSGTTLTPNTATERVIIPGAPAGVMDQGTAVVFGSRTVKGRLFQQPTNDSAALMGNAYLSSSAVWSLDDSSKPGWMLRLGVDLDSTIIYRFAPSTAIATALLNLDNAGNLTALGTLYAGPAAVKGGLGAAADLSSANVNGNNPWAPQDTTRHSWGLLFTTTTATGSNAQASLFYRAPGAAVGATTQLFYVDGLGNLFMFGPTLTTGARTTAYQGIRVNGTDAGIRCQNIGNNAAAGDGYSDAMAFGYGASGVVVRVNSTQLGSVNVTPPSDTRYKRDVREDVPGLDAVCALRPVTFEYDHTVRELLPPGRRYGLIAQEARAHVPLVIEDDESDEHMLALDYRLLVPVLIRAIQELAAKVK